MALNLSIVILKLTAAHYISVFSASLDCLRSHSKFFLNYVQEGWLFDPVPWDQEWSIDPVLSLEKAAQTMKLISFIWAIMADIIAIESQKKGS